MDDYVTLDHLRGRSGVPHMEDKEYFIGLFLYRYRPEVSFSYHSVKVGIDHNLLFGVFDMFYYYSCIIFQPLIVLSRKL